MLRDYRRALDIAVAAALEAGAVLRADLHRPNGPRGEGGHADADGEAEHAIRQALTAAFPTWGYVGEETGSSPRAPGEPHTWLVDPNDGTSQYVKGSRGSAVSIALLRDGVPVLGVVYAFSAPDDDGDLFAWAEACGPLRRNGREVQRPAWPATLGAYDVLLLSPALDRRTQANLRLASPARCRSMPSIAYRLALTAAGDGTVAVSLNSPGAWDYAAGHAILRGAGGEFVDQDGRPVAYSPDGDSGTMFCFGGAPGLVRGLATRQWQEVFNAPREAAEPYDLLPPVRGLVSGEAGVLARAQGCLLGQLAGDALGSAVEFESASQIAREHPGGLHRMADGGTWNTLAGQPTDDSELALMLARSIVEAGTYSPESAARAYHYWYHSDPFDCGRTTRRAIGAIRESDIARGRAAKAASRAASRVSEANESLMRASPLGIWGFASDPRRLALLARADSALTHPDEACCDSVDVFVTAVAHAIRTGSQPDGIYSVAVERARETRCDPAVLAALLDAAREPPSDFMSQQGWVAIALQNAFHQLLHARSLEDGIVKTVMAGGDTDTNAAIAGALLGAVHGRGAVPPAWQRMILTCRPLAGLPGVHRPRPRAFWPVDAPELAERLVVMGSRIT